MAAQVGSTVTPNQHGRPCHAPDMAIPSEEIRRTADEAALFVRALPLFRHRCIQ